LCVATNASQIASGPARRCRSNQTRAGHFGALSILRSGPRRSVNKNSPGRCHWPVDSHGPAWRVREAGCGGCPFLEGKADFPDLLIPGRAQPDIAFFVGDRDHRHCLGMDRLDNGVRRLSSGSHRRRGGPGIGFEFGAPVAFEMQKVRQPAALFWAKFRPDFWPRLSC
jgi:hypothetical protein